MVHENCIFRVLPYATKHTLFHVYTVNTATHTHMYKHIYSVPANVHGGHGSRVAVPRHPVHVNGTRARSANTETNVVDDRVHRLGWLRYGCACGMADGPHGTQVHRKHVYTAHVHRMDVVIERPSSESCFFFFLNCYNQFVSLNNTRYRPNPKKIFYFFINHLAGQVKRHLVVCTDP